MMAQRAALLDTSLDALVKNYERVGPVPIDEDAYLRIALNDPGTKWELRDGLLVEKPQMSFVHGGTVIWLRDSLVHQLDRSEFLVFADAGRLRRTDRTYLIPDLAVIPTDLFRRYVDSQPDGLGVFSEPIPFVAEAWSPSTGSYDVNLKIPEYRRRGDREIWRFHPFERALTAWRRQEDGTYSKSEYQGGLVQVESLPDVTIDLDALFDLR
jgi:Uma2 family endonuclease